MSAATLATIIYGLLSAIGGIIGYVKAGSAISLISGLVSGVLLLALGLLQWQGRSWPVPTSLAISLLLVATFSVRLAKTGKFMPAGVMIIAGVATAVVLVSELL